MSVRKKISLVGYASGLAGASSGSGDGPLVLKESLLLKNDNLEWVGMVQPPQHLPASKFTLVSELCQELGKKVIKLAEQNQFFTVLGGDHSCAIGTWSAVSSIKKPLGLIWVDAHMDSHTPQTSATGNIHGMPLASLLGYGDNNLTKMFHVEQKLKPENVCLIGIRSYEEGEAELLKRLNVRVFYMEEVHQRGLAAVFADAVNIVTNGTVGYGISIDIDSMDPADAPGTGVAEPDGLSAQKLINSVRSLAQDSRLIGAEIVEFDPHRDKDKRTEKIIAQLLGALAPE